jgi:hypothetical protein
VLAPWQALAIGSWTNLVNAPPGNNAVQLMLLLSDGTVMAQQQGTSSAWYRLTPDTNGSYVTGTWTTIAPMIYSHQYYASAVLRDGRVFVAGGEYGSGGNKAEIYNPRSDSWTEIPVPAGLICTTCGSPGISDADSVILPNGNVLIAPVIPSSPNGTVIYDPSSNTFSPGPAYLVNQNEATWVKLPDDSILTIDPSSNPNQLNTSERYIPSLNIWTNDATLPVPMYNSAQEIGAGLLLPDGRALFIGGRDAPNPGHTCYYTPSGNTSPGTWTAGPDLIGDGVGWDEPAAMMVNGKVLLQTICGPIQNPQPRCFYELDPASNYPVGTITPAIDWGDTSGVSHIMLNLPDGKVLVSYGSSVVKVYIPDGVPTAAGKPTISSITMNGDGSYHLVGTKLNGLSQGSSFGDDAQMDSNFPIVRLTDGSGRVYYARTYNWSSTGVATGNTPVSTEFTLPTALFASGHTAFSLVVVANGISSDPVAFTSPSTEWVDFNYSGFLQVGTFTSPFRTLALGVGSVPTGGTVLIKTAGSSVEPMTINTAMRIVATGGPATIH